MPILILEVVPGERINRQVMGVVVYDLMASLFGLILLLTIAYGIVLVVRFFNEYRESFDRIRRQLRRRLVQTLRP